MSEVTQEQIAASENAVPPSEPAAVEVAEPAVTDTAEPETDEEKNARVARETQERSEKRTNGYQKRVNELTADKYAERQAREAAERREAQLLEMLRAKDGQQAQKQGDGPPTREQFTDYEDFVAAKAVYAATRKAEERMAERLAQSERASRDQAMQLAAQQVTEKFRSRVDEFSKTKPDFSEIVSENQDVRIPNEASALVQMMDDGPEILYHMGKNPEIAQRLWGKPPIQQAVMLGQISASLRSSVPEVSKAPSPGKPVGAKSGDASTPPSDMEGYMRWRKKLRA